MTKIKALALFSGGLDSILASRLIIAQGIEVQAIQFVTPFFNYGILADPEGHRERIRQKYGIEVLVEDISEGYLRLLHRPAHGFGKNFNPCIDCKIMMFSRAREMLAERGASFLISGEVLGQRPMSQRRDTMNVIERDSGTRGLLLRPLCARLMSETLAEQRGWVDRSRLLAMSGRGRSAQIALAAEFGITDFPAPAGGCILADPILSRRVERLYNGNSLLQTVEISVADVRMLLVGRQFVLPGGGWLIIGRDERENNKLMELADPEDAVLLMEEWPGPVGVLKKAAASYADPGDLALACHQAAAIVVRYGKKQPPGKRQGEVTCTFGGARQLIAAEPLADEIFQPWAMM